MNEKSTFYDLGQFSHDEELMTAERAAQKAAREVEEAIQHATEMIVLYDGHPDIKQETEGPIRKTHEALHSFMILRSIVLKRLVEVDEKENELDEVDEEGDMSRYELDYNEEWLADLFRKKNLQVCCLDDVIGTPGDSDRDQIVWQKHKDRIFKMIKSTPAIMEQLGYRRGRYDFRMDGKRMQHTRWVHNSVPRLTSIGYYKLWLEKRKIKK